MFVLLQVIEYPDATTNFISRVIAKIPYAVTAWKVLAIIWVLTLCYLIVYINRRPANTKYISVYLALAIVGIVGLRFPNLILPMLNYDEADWAVCAATLWSKSIFWKDVDATTSGPLNIYPLLIIKVLGGNINYFTLRLFLLLFCCVPTFLFSFQAFKKYETPPLAAALTAPLVIGFALLNDTDLVSFDSTYIPMVVLALVYYLLFSIGYLKNKVQSALAVGFILGLFPFIKLQAVPVAVGLGIWLLYNAYFLWKFSLRSIVLILVSSIAPCILVGIYIAIKDLHTDFWESYVLNNLLYAKLGIVSEEKSWWFKLRVPLYLINTSPTIALFFYALGGAALVSGVYCFLNFKRIEFRNRIEIIGATAVFFLSYYAISQPGNICHYYLILIVVPLFFMTSVNVLLAKKLMDEAGGGRYGNAVLLALLLTTVGLQGFASIRKGSLGVNDVAAGYRGMVNPPLIEQIKELVQPNDLIAVLGYRPDIYIATNTLLGIREAQTTRMHFAFKDLQKDYYQNRIASDIITNKPKLVIDASLNSNGSYPYNDSTTIYENYPVLKKTIDSSYVHHTTIDQIRIFVAR